MSSEWRETTLGDCVSFVSGNTPSKSNPSFWNGDIPWISAKDMKSFWVEDAEDHLTADGVAVASRLVPPGTTLLLTRGMTLHNDIPIVRTRKSATFNQDVKALFPRRGVSTDFVPYLLLGNKSRIQSIVDSAGHGTGRLGSQQLKALSLVCPSDGIQEELALFFAALADRITLLRETNATLEAIAQALFKSWFIDFDPVHAKQQGRAPEGMDEATAALFPDGFEEPELGLVPRGWRVMPFGDFIERQSVGKKYDQKSACPEGDVPILDQGKSGIIGFHNAEPGIRASLDKPVVVFANHTCYMRLITFDFSAIQNVLPFTGKGVDTIWSFYATKDRVKFSEYKGHWPDFAIEKAVSPDEALTLAFRGAVDPLIRSMRNNELQAQTLATLRDTLLPRLISGQLRLPEAELAIDAAV